MGKRAEQSGIKRNFKTMRDWLSADFCLESGSYQDLLEQTLDLLIGVQIPASQLIHITRLGDGG